MEFIKIQNSGDMEIKLFFFFILLVSSMSCAVIPNDEDAVSAFKSTITYDPFQVLTKNWSANTSVCHWIGVSCTHHRVTALNFSGFGFEGTLPPNLGNITHLTWLDIRSNNFTGFIPHHLSSLHQLQFIDLGFNRFTGAIPTWFGDLHNLKHIYLNNNNFTGSIPSWLGHNISNLHTLNLAYNSLQGNIPPQIGNLTSMVKLDLTFNQLTGSIPPAIFNVSGIETIDLTGNMLSGSLPEDICSSSVTTKLMGLYVSLNLLGGQIPFNIYKCSHLQRLSLSYNHFNGTIPRSVGWLVQIETLFLGVNSFQGGIPMDLRNLSRLQILSFRGIGLTGQLPSFIFNMSSLRWIDFSNNSLSGSISMPVCSNLPNLELLHLNSNQLTGQILDRVWDCKALSTLLLSDNKFTGAMPKSLGNLTSLQYLFLDGNNITGNLPAELGNLNLVQLNVHGNGLSGGIPPSIFNISSVEVLGLSDNHFSGTLPSTTGLSLPSLQELDLSSNKLSGGIPGFIINASSLTLLNMGQNSFTGPVPDFAGLRQLQQLALGLNNLTGESPNQELRFLTSLTQCRSLLEFELSENQLHGTLPVSIGNFSSSLQIFRAFGSQISGHIPVEIGNLTGLRDLYLDSNELTGLIPTTIGKSKQLIRIYLEYNKLEGHIPSDICQLPKLGDFYVSNNALNGPIPPCIGEIKSLQRLYLDSNKLESDVPSTLWNLVDLVALNLSSNMLTGSLPSQVGNLKVVVDLDLSWNQFSGEVPSAIDKADSLVFLSLAHNKFKGSIPESLANLRGLESLDLSFNNISGYIPNSLASLRYLRHFNVAYNMLEGEIPTGGSFANFTAQSFLKNYGLCGEARLRVPPCKRKSRANKMKYIAPLTALAIILLAATLLLIMRRRKPRPEVDHVDDASQAQLQSWIGTSYRELVQATNDFSESNLVGSGSYGSVFIGTLSNGITAAIKVFKLESERVSRSFETEVEILSGVRHRNLIKILGLCSNEDFKALVLEYMPNGSLDRWLYSHNYFLDLQQRLSIAIDVAFALEHLHSGHTFPIVHCDLKPSNVLLDNDMTAHVSDFGIAKLFGEGEAAVAHTRTLGSIGYMAPEYGGQGMVSTGCDVYSFGVMLVEMCTRRRPTDEMFGEEMSFKSWVRRALLENKINEVVDANLVAEGVKDDFSCLSSLLRLAMECLADSGADRISMSMAVAKLEQIRALITAKVGVKARRSDEDD